MKEKIRKIWEDHKTEILAGAFVGAIAGGLYAVWQNQSVGADIYVRDDGKVSLIKVTQRNGDVKNFQRYLEDGVPELAKMLAMREVS